MRDGGLIGALLPNFFLVFILVRDISHTVGDGPGRHYGMHGRDFKVGQLTESLAPASKNIVRNMIKSRNSPMWDNFSVMGDPRKTLEQTLTAEKVGADALERRSPTFEPRT